MEYSDIFGRNFILIIIATIGIYSIFLIFSDINLIYDKLLNFNWKFLPSLTNILEKIAAEVIPSVSN